jgi:hypothetical protein
MASQLSIVTSLRLHSSVRQIVFARRKCASVRRLKGGWWWGEGGTMWSIAKKHPLTVPALFGVNMDTPTSPSPSPSPHLFLIYSFLSRLAKSGKICDLLHYNIRCKYLYCRMRYFYFGFLQNKFSQTICFDGKIKHVLLYTLERFQSRMWFFVK